VSGSRGTACVQRDSAKVGSPPDSAAPQLGQQAYTAIFTYPEVGTAAAGLPLEFVADDSVHDYEKRHLPETT
jgi:hypothetical protein